MRLLRFAGILMIIFLMAAFAAAKLNQFGVEDTYQVTFNNPVRVADTLLPSGDYEILHTMQGQDHIMLFRQLRTRRPVEVKVKCTLVTLPEKATNTQKIYALNNANERVLRELIFKGDKAKHVF